MARDGEATKAAILQAARTEFSAHGLAGARVDRIATSAGSSKERLYTLYGDKEQLYRRVMSTMLEEMRLATVVYEETDIDTYVRSAYDFHQKNPHLLRMLLWEALEGTGGALPDEEARRDCYRLSARALTPLVPEDDQDAESKRLLLTLIGLTAWPTAVPTLATIVTNGESDTQAGQRRLRDFTASFATAALRGLGTALPARIGGGAARRPLRRRTQLTRPSLDPVDVTAGERDQAATSS
jgi:AcrR family transcriptional regulator